MKSMLFGKNIEPDCSYCIYSRVGNNTTLCRKKGKLSVKKACRKFEYDPLKRVPKKIKINSDLTKKDFEL
jgi:hypothetical protein